MYFFIGFIASIAILIVAGVLFAAVKSGDKDTAGLGCVMIGAMLVIFIYSVYRILVVDEQYQDQSLDEEITAPAIAPSSSGDDEFPERETLPPDPDEITAP